MAPSLPQGSVAPPAAPAPAARRRTAGDGLPASSGRAPRAARLITKAAAVLGLAAPGTLAFDFPDIDISNVASIDSSSDSNKPGATASENCSPQNLARYPSGWPTALDWGIYWYGPNDQFKKASPRQQASMLDPPSWFDKGDQYDNATERWNSEFYDPSRNTVIYFHGWSGTGAWSTKDCKRVTTKCDPNLCPNGGGHQLAEPWLRRGWNVGFFYWDQFADEPCIRDAEQKLWFDRRGNGLRWASYNPANNSLEWRQYKGDALSVTDLCVTAVKEAMGDFYSGRTVRFVGRSIGSQLAVGCAAQLHEERHVAAPQRMVMLDPFFTQKELSFDFLGAGIRCGKVTSSVGIEDFAQEATANYVKMLWLTHRVATEVFNTADESTGLGTDTKANKDMQTYAVQVAYKPRWCSNSAELQCKHRAVFPMYFLGVGVPPPPLVEETTGRMLNSYPKTCAVPAASCSDAEIRALVEEHVALVQKTSVGLLVPTQKNVWTQVAGTDTFNLTDDTFAVAGGLQLATVAPNEAIEKEVATQNAIAQRDWGMSRSWHLGPESGMSTDQLRFGARVLITFLAVPLFAFLTFRLGRLVLDKLSADSAGEDEEEEEEEESDIEDAMSKNASPTSCSRKQALMAEDP